MTALHQTEVDGVRCFWVDTGRPTLAAALLFRYGQADEPFTESGFVHLLEHLALHGRGSGPLHVNGQVGLIETSLEAHGPPDLVARHFRDVTDWLAAPSFEELERERNVLRAEASLRGEGPAARALNWRFGASGPGLSVYAEPGLGRATPELLTGRARQAFTRGNAVLVLDGPPPPELHLGLADGPLITPAPAVPVEKFPAMCVDEAGLVLSGVVPRSAAMSCALQLLRDVLAERLRHQDGAAYAPWSSYERIDAEHAVLLGGSDVLAEALPTLADTALQLVKQLRAGPEPAKLADLKASLVQSMRDPYAQVGVAFRAGSATLHGHEVMTFDELIAEVESIEPGEVAEGFEAFERTLLLGLPGKTAWRKQLPQLEQRTSMPHVEAKVYRHINWPADRTRLLLSDNTVQMALGDRAVGVTVPRAQGVLASENGMRHVVGNDGFTVTVNPHLWRRGDEAVRRIDEMTPPDKLLPMPPVDGIDQVRRQGAVQRWGQAGRHALRSAAGTRVMLVLLALGLVAIAIALSVPAVAAGAVVALVSALRDRDAA